MNTPSVSIIVPIYNAEPYIKRCLDSIALQTYKNIEVLLIDDGSKDSSALICDEYAKRDTRFVVVHKENGGVSSARNAGIDKASGEWILFVDADDVVPQDTFLYYANSIASNDIEMILGSYVECDENGVITKSDTRQFEKQISMLDCLKLFYQSDTNLFQGYIWNRPMKHSVIRENKLQFNESIHFKEDGLFAVQYMLCCTRKCLYSSHVVYNYYQHENSSMHIYNSAVSDKYLTNYDARILCLQHIISVYNDKDLINSAKYSILKFYYQIKTRIRNTSSDSLSLRANLFFRLICSIGAFYYIRFRLASLKGVIYNKLKNE